MAGQADHPNAMTSQATPAPVGTLAALHGESDRVPVVDAHLHLWDLHQVAYPWLTPAHGSLYRTFSPDEIAPALAVMGVGATVLVQAADSPEETRFLSRLAENHDFIRGVVGWAPLLEPDGVVSCLDEHTQLVGVRYPTRGWGELDRNDQQRVVASLEILVEHDRTLDVAPISPSEVEEVITLSERIPELRVVIDHLAKPPIRQSSWEPWASTLARAASRPNTYAKISGLMTAADWRTWTVPVLQRYVDHAITTFGPSRLMAGSDWPVSTLAGDYITVWSATCNLVSGLPVSDQEAILGGSASRFYRFSGPDGSRVAADQKERWST